MLLGLVDYVVIVRLVIGRRRLLLLLGDGRRLSCLLFARLFARDRGLAHSSAGPRVQGLAARLLGARHRQLAGRLRAPETLVLSRLGGRAGGRAQGRAHRRLDQAAHLHLAQAQVRVRVAGAACSPFPIERGAGRARDGQLGRVGAPVAASLAASGRALLTGARVHH